MLIAENLVKTYGTASVVKNLSLTVREGEIVGFLGPNGAGKTTTVGMLYGLVIPDSGSVTIGGIDLGTEPRRARRLIGVVPQEDNLDPDFSTEENLVRFATYYGMSIAEGERRAKVLLEQVSLSEHGKKRIDELSGGMKRRLILARALIHQPKLIFLDEPTTGLDPDARQDFWRVVLKLRAEGTAILLTTHYMEEAERLCSRVFLIQDGEILDENSPVTLIQKYVGDRVCEVDGIAKERIEELAKELNLWARPYSSGYMLPLPLDTKDKILARLNELGATTVNERRGNLEDVFLGLTGRSLKA